jgi:hypothetical protein
MKRSPPKVFRRAGRIEVFVSASVAEKPSQLAGAGRPMARSCWWALVPGSAARWAVSPCGGRAQLAAGRPRPHIRGLFAYGAIDEDEPLPRWRPPGRSRPCGSRRPLAPLRNLRPGGPAARASWSGHGPGRLYQGGEFQEAAAACGAMLPDDVPCGRSPSAGNRQHAAERIGAALAAGAGLRVHVFPLGARADEDGQGTFRRRFWRSPGRARKGAWRGACGPNQGRDVGGGFIRLHHVAFAHRGTLLLAPRAPTVVLTGLPCPALCTLKRLPAGFTERMIPGRGRAYLPLLEAPPQGSSSVFLGNAVGQDCITLLLRCRTSIDSSGRSLRSRGVAAWWHEQPRPGGHRETKARLRSLPRRGPGSLLELVESTQPSAGPAGATNDQMVERFVVMAMRFTR